MYSLHLSNFSRSSKIILFFLSKLEILFTKMSVFFYFFVQIKVVTSFCHIWISSISLYFPDNYFSFARSIFSLISFSMSLYFVTFLYRCCHLHSINLKIFSVMLFLIAVLSWLITLFSHPFSTVSKGIHRPDLHLIINY